MHDYAPSGSGVPGQSGNSSVYPAQLTQIAARLNAYAASNPRTKVVFFLTTPYLCDANIQTEIAGLNAAAAPIMAAARIPVVDPFSAINSHWAARTSRRGATTAGARTAPRATPGWPAARSRLPSVRC
jgi:hypothetical protein